MMGFGTYGYGGPYLSSSSSSSLSALAPPFTVERPVPKPISSPVVESFTPLLEVTEPPYAAHSSMHNWLPPLSPSSGSNFYANPPPALDSGPSANAYRYAGLPTVDSFSTNLPPMNTVGTPSSNAYTYDQGSDVAATNYVEAKPYYPSYLSPAISDSPMPAPSQPTYDWLSTSQFDPLDGSPHKEYTQRPSSSKYTAQWGGSWNGPAEWEQGKQGQFDGNFVPKETDVSSLPYKDYLNQEPHSSNSLRPYGVNEVASHNIPDWNGSANAEQLGDQSFVGINSKFNPIDFTKPRMGLNPKSLFKAPSSLFVAKSTYGVSCEKRQHDASRNDITSISKFPSAFILKPPAIGTKSSEPEMGLFKKLNSGREAANADHVGYNPSQESRLTQSFVDKVSFDSSQLAIHLGRTDPFSVESSSAQDKALSNNGSINNNNLDFFKARPGLPNSHVNPDGFDATVTINDSIDSFLNSSENVDPNNPAVDSPCWKGVPGSRFSPFKLSEEGGPEKMKKLEGCDGCDGLNLNMPMIFSLNTGENISTQKPVQYQEYGWLGNGLPLPLKKSSVANSASGEHKLDDTMKTTYYPESGQGLQGYVNTPNSEGGDKSSSVFEHSHTVPQGCGEGGLTTETRNKTWSAGADVNLNISDTLECGSSHTPPVESTFCSPSVEGAATKLTKSNSIMDVQMLVNTMNSLSELLLTNCSNSSHQLKKKDLDVVKAVINNLNSCILKHDEIFSSMPESPSVRQSTVKYIEELCKPDENVLSMPESPPVQQSTLEYIEELCKPNKALTLDMPVMPQLTKIFVPSIQDPNHLQGVQKLKNYDNVVKNDDEVMGSVSAKSDIDLLKQDEMTQAIKKILSENFHTEDTHPQTLLYKNLWLEAEAEICSTNYKARFDRLKIEMEKCKADRSKDVLEHTADVMTQLRSEVCANLNSTEKLTPEVQGCPLPESNLQESTLNHEDKDVMARFHILRSRIENSSSMNATNVDESCSSLSLFPDKVAPEADARPSPGISLQDSSTSSISGLTNDYDASVMVRFHIIRGRIENSKFISDGNLEDPVGSKVSHEHEADEVAPETTDNGSIQEYPDSVQEFNTQDYPVPITPITTTSHANQSEDSVLARFKILNSRVDNSSHIPSVGVPLEHVDLGYAGKRKLGPVICNRSEDGGSDVKEQPVLQSYIADNNEGNFMVTKEFSLFGEDVPGRMINKPLNQLPASCPDRSSSSDWEHVMKEEIWGHGC